MKGKTTAAATALLLGSLLGVGPVNAGVIFSDDFAEADITGAHGNFTSLDQWNVTDGTVDAFRNGGFSLPCLSEGCLDLDGSSGNGGRIETKTTFSLWDNTLYTLSITYRGNARGSSPDNLIFGLTGVSAFQWEIPSIAAAQEWDTFVVNFAYLVSPFTAKLYVSTDSNDNIGPLLDKVVLEQRGNGTVPEPATLALLGMGLGGLGFSRRRTR